MATQYPPDFSKVENLLQDIAHKNNQEKTPQWHQTWWGKGIIALIVAILAGLIVAVIGKG